MTYDTVTRIWDRLGELNYCAPQTPKFNPDEKLSCSFDVSPLQRTNNETRKHSSLNYFLLSRLDITSALLVIIIIIQTFRWPSALLLLSS